MAEILEITDEIQELEVELKTVEEGSVREAEINHRLTVLDQELVDLENSEEDDDDDYDDDDYDDEEEEEEEEIVEDEENKRLIEQ